MELCNTQSDGPWNIFIFLKEKGHSGKHEPNSCEIGKVLGFWPCIKENGHLGSHECGCGCKKNFNN